MRSAQLSVFGLTLFCVLDALFDKLHVELLVFAFHLLECELLLLHTVLDLLCKLCLCELVFWLSAGVQVAKLGRSHGLRQHLCLEPHFGVVKHFPSENLSPCLAICIRHVVGVADEVVFIVRLEPHIVKLVFSLILLLALFLLLFLVHKLV